MPKQPTLDKEIQRSIAKLSRRGRDGTPESNVQHAVMDLLLAERIPAIRLNCGGLPDKSGRPVWFARWMDGKPADGISDILAFVRQCYLCRQRGMKLGSYYCANCAALPPALWIELKAPGGKQRASQVEFQRWVEACGCEYLLGDVDEVRDWLKGHLVVR